MTVRILTIPDDQTQWPGWLEQQIVGLHLRELIEELRVVNKASGSASTSKSLSKILNAKQIEAINQSGLGTVSVPLLRRLMENPDSLLELQELVLTEGSSFWQTIPVDSETRSAVNRVEKKLAGALDKRADASAPIQKSAKAAGRSRRSFAWFVSVAAMLLIGVFLWRSQPDSAGDIFGTPGLVTNDTTSSAEYLERIAAAGETWFDKDRNDAAKMIALLEQTSRDCQTLIDARHEALSPEERDWFVTKCINWKAQFDATLASLKSGTITLETARSQSDLTMMKLVAALRSGPAA